VNRLLVLPWYFQVCQTTNPNRLVVEKDGKEREIFPAGLHRHYHIFCIITSFAQIACKGSVHSISLHFFDLSNECWKPVLQSCPHIFGLYTKKLTRPCRPVPLYCRPRLGCRDRNLFLPLPPPQPCNQIDDCLPPRTHCRFVQSHSPTPIRVRSLEFFFKRDKLNSRL
jgi:hypothetical protein